TKISSPTRCQTMHWRLQRAACGGITPNFSPSVMPPAPNTPNAAGEFPVPDLTLISGKAAAWRGTLDQTDEEILTYTVSDDAIEAAAGIGGGQPTQVFCWTPTRCAPACG